MLDRQRCIQEAELRERRADRDGEQPPTRASINAIRGIHQAGEQPRVALRRQSEREDQRQRQQAAELNHGMEVSASKRLVVRHYTFSRRPALDIMNMDRRLSRHGHRLRALLSFGSFLRQWVLCGVIIFHCLGALTSGIFGQQQVLMRLRAERLMRSGSAFLAVCLQVRLASHLGTNNHSRCKISDLAASNTKERGWRTSIRRETVRSNANSSSM